MEFGVWWQPGGQRFQQKIKQEAQNRIKCVIINVKQIAETLPSLS